MSTTAPPPQLTKSQLNTYLDYIGLAELANLADDVPRDLDLLTRVHVHQISAVPYENLKLHYDTTHQVSVDPHVVYTKILTGRGRGGYCMEVSCLFKYILEGLGFNVYWTGVRIRPRNGPTPWGDYIGLVHMVNIITLSDGSRYVCDVAFGGDGPIRPLPLLDNHVTQNLGTQQIRYTRARILETTPPAPDAQEPNGAHFTSDANGVQKPIAVITPSGDNISPSEKPPGSATDPLTFWVYQYRNKLDLPWNSYYCFQEVPFMYSDFCIMSYAASQPAPHGSSPFQTTTVLGTRFLRSEEKPIRIIGKRMLVNGTFKGFEGGTSTQVLRECKSEQERVEGLKQYFGITLTDEEINGIKGRMTEIRTGINE